MAHSEVEEGGETTLPLASAIDGAQHLQNASQCASKMGIAIKPQKGGSCSLVLVAPCSPLA
jgi:hypothetical protein